jgi:alpha-tubulin suppressor-like RCC1 family protein
MNGVAELAAGGGASAVIDFDGKLWMWGRVVDLTNGGQLPPARTAMGKQPLPCFNSIEESPVRISDIDSAQHVALGTNHVLVSVMK